MKERIIMKRRRFIKSIGAGAAGLGLPSASGISAVLSRTERTQVQEGEEPRIKAYRPLGNTGLRLSDIGCGAINLLNPSVLRYAFDRGVNHFDTAELYLNTNSEKYLGQALKDIRTKVLITTKHLIRTPADLNRAALISRVEASLKRLQTDYLDVALVHSVDRPGQLDEEELLAAYTQLKKDGKARFIGFSTHNAFELLPKAIASGPWEVILLIYNHMEGARIEPQIVRARAKGIGLIAMKVLAGGMQDSLNALAGSATSYAQAAIRWSLGNPSIDACITSMSTFSHVDEYVAASGATPKRSDAAKGQYPERSDADLLACYRDEAEGLYCRVSCRECLSACPHGVAINDILRYGMYFEHYRMEKNALQQYEELDPGRRPEACENCEAPCVEACPYGLKVRERLLRLQEMLRP